MSCSAVAEKPTSFEVADIPIPPNKFNRSYVYPSSVAMGLAEGKEGVAFTVFRPRRNQGKAPGRAEPLARAGGQVGAIAERDAKREHARRRRFLRRAGTASVAITRNERRYEKARGDGGLPESWRDWTRSYVCT